MSPQPPQKGRGPQPPQGGGRPQPQPQRGQPQKPQPQRAPAKPQKIEVTSFKGPDQVHFACPACQMPFSMKAKAAGKKAKCPCGARILIPPPGGVPRALNMPSAESIKRAQQQWKSAGADKNPSEIALESSTGTKVMLAGLVFAAIGVGIWWKNQQGASNAGGAGPILNGSSDSGSSSDAPAGDLASVLKAGVAGVEVLDDKGALIGSGAGSLVAENVFATSAWLLVGGTTVRVRLPDGTPFTVGAVEGLDLDNDVAILRLEGTTLKGIPLDESGQAEEGSVVGLAAHGKPGTNVAMPQGALRNPLLPGQTGSPLLNPRGFVVGFAVRRAGGEPGAAPLSAVRALLAKREPIPVADALALKADRPVSAVTKDVARLRASGRTLAALGILEKSLTRNAGDTRLLLEVAELLVHTGRPREAARRLAAIPSPTAQVRFALGIARLETRQDLQALRDFRAAPGGADESAVQAAIALALARLGDATRAKVAVERALLERTAAPGALRHAALACATLGDKEGESRAIEAFGKASGEPGGKSRLTSAAALARGDKAAAEAAAREAVAEDPGAASSVALARALLAAGKAPEARAALAGIPASPLHEDAHLVLAQAHLGEGTGDARRTGVLEALAPLLADGTHDAEAHALAAEVLRGGDAAARLRHLEQVLTLRPDSETDLLSLVEALRDEGHAPAGEERLAAFLQLHPDAHAVRIELAVAKATGQPEEALKQLDRLPIPGTLAGRGWFARGLALMAQSKGPEAYTAFCFAVSHDAANGEYLWHRALAAEGQNIHEARAHWEAYVAWGKANGEDAERIASAEKRLLLRFGR